MAAESEEGVEVVGRTVDEAVQKGLDMLHLRRDQVSIEIVSDGARTLLGFRPGQVRVRMAPKSGLAKPHRAEERRGTRNRVGSEVSPTVAAAGQEAPPEVVARRAEPGAVGTGPTPEANAKPATEAVGDELDVARRLLADLLERMGLRASVEVHPGTGEEPARLNITGRNLAMLIGRRGETLAALQFLTRLMVSHKVGHWVSVAVDVDNYRLKREETLRRLAVRMGEQAIETGRVQELEPMPPAERRIIHLALRDFAGVSSQSIGEGESRRVTIIPARSSRS
jgi:spoIIIJ-associated protein